MLSENNWNRVKQMAAANESTFTELNSEWPKAAAAIQRITRIAPDATDQAHFIDTVLPAINASGSSMAPPPPPSAGYGQRDCVVAATDGEPNKEGTA